MSDTLTRCQACQALANPAWLNCAACNLPLGTIPPQSAEREPGPPSPISPILVGWIIGWRDRTRGLCGGCDNRERGTVKTAAWGPTGWTFTVSSGESVPLHAIVAVARTDEAGRVLGAWLVRECGPDGKRTHV